MDKKDSQNTDRVPISSASVGVKLPVSTLPTGNLLLVDYRKYLKEAKELWKKGLVSNTPRIIKVDERGMYLLHGNKVYFREKRDGSSELELIYKNMRRHDIEGSCPPFSVLVSFQVKGKTVFLISQEAKSIVVSESKGIISMIKGMTGIEGKGGGISSTHRFTTYNGKIDQYIKTNYKSTSLFITDDSTDMDHLVMEVKIEKIASLGNIVKNQIDSAKKIEMEYKSLWDMSTYT